MKLWHLKLFLISALLFLSGCCYFVPCHPATYMTGIVIDGVSKQTITKANVHLYYYETHTAPSGCFALGGANALPFEFGVSAQGYKPLVVKAVPGFYRATVSLIPKGNNGESVYEYEEISREQYAELSHGCP